MFVFYFIPGPPIFKVFAIAMFFIFLLLNIAIIGLHIHWHNNEWEGLCGLLFTLGIRDTKVQSVNIILMFLNSGLIWSIFIAVMKHSYNLAMLKEGAVL